MSGGQWSPYECGPACVGYCELVGTPCREKTIGSVHRRLIAAAWHALRLAQRLTRRK